jgi:signal transduction histidine kinase/ligand-binding sensor domain-containing protein/ActR/RegA family two-component response regulator
VTNRLLTWLEKAAPNRLLPGLLLGLVVGFVVEGPVRGQRFAVRSYAEVDGMPSASLRDVLQGPDGRMWFASRLGLFSYDGGRWAFAESVPRIGFARLDLDPEGGLWAVQQQAPFRVIRRAASPRGATVPPVWERQRSLPLRARSIIEDVVGLGPGRAVAATHEGLLVLENGEWRRADQGVPGEVPVLCAERWGQRVYFGKTTGLWSLASGSSPATPVAFEPAPLSGGPVWPVLGLLADGDRLWVAGQQELGVVERGGYRSVLRLEDGAFSRVVTRIELGLDGEGGVFVGGDLVPTRHMRSDGRLELLGSAMGLQEAGITSFAIDFERNVWASSLRGVHKLMSGGIRSYDADSGLMRDEVSALERLADGRIVAAQDGWLCFFGDQVEEPLALPVDPTVARIMQIESDERGRMWLAASWAGLGIVEPDRSTAFFELPGDAQLHALARDGEALWCGTSSGLWRFEGGVFRRPASQSPADAEFASNGIRRLLLEEGGVLWVATSFDGLYRRSSDGSILRIQTGDADRDSVYTMLRTSKGRMLVGTRGGLMELDGERLRKSSLEVARPVYLLVEDAEHDRLWVGTNKGVIQFGPSGSRHIGPGDGLAGPEANRDAGLIMSSGELWVGTDGGLSVLPSGLDRLGDVEPRVAWLSLRCSKRSLPLRDSELELEPRASLDARFSVLSYVDEERIRIRSRMLGLTEEWSSWGLLRSRTLRFPSLPPGRYQLEVQAWTADGRRSRVLRSPVLQVPVPWHESLWLRLFFVALIVLAALGGGASWMQRRQRRELEREVERRTEQLAESERQLAQDRADRQRLESIGLLAGGIAHDFNNYLTVVLGTLEMLDAEIELTPTQRRFVESSQKMLERATSLTQQLLTFSRGGAPLRRSVELRTLLSDSVRFALSGSALVADIQVQPGLERIWVDEGQLGQVLHNLLINARQAIPGKGRVELRARRAEIPELGAVVRIEIEDDGPGIEKEDWDTVFEPFYSTRSEGTGLGLSIAQSVLFRHGGRILLEEGSKGGACFVLLLPDLVGSEPEEDARAATRDLPSARILVMDDEDGVREILRSMLERLGHEVTAVSDGEEALRLYREAAASGAAFDLAILDLTVPGGMGGREAARRILALDSAARLIAASGYSSDSALAKHAQHGFKGALAKPFRMRDVEHVLARALL